jgi:NADP-dependent 3-hydroxy acid dehydrogenase YdfG
MMPFVGQIAVVTGATGAVGRAISEELLQSGATVVAVGSSQRSLDEVFHAAGWPEDRVHGEAVDLECDKDVERFCVKCLERYRRIEILVHCAGVIELGPIATSALADFDRQYRVNVRAPFQITQRLSGCLVASRAQVVFINSTAGLRASRGGSQYGATKHALKAVADSLRDELNGEGVRVTSIFLGRTASRMQERVFHHEGRPYDGAKLLQPKDVAAVIVRALQLPRTAEITDVWIRPMLKSY